MPNARRTEANERAAAAFTRTFRGVLMLRDPLMGRMQYSGRATGTTYRGSEVSCVCSGIGPPRDMAKAVLGVTQPRCQTLVNHLSEVSGDSVVSVLYVATHCVKPPMRRVLWVWWMGVSADAERGWLRQECADDEERSVTPRGREDVAHANALRMCQHW